MNQEILAAMRQCDPDLPLEADDQRWVDLDGARGIAVHRNLLRLLYSRADAGYAHIALAGHRGSGKSTELKRLIAQARSDGFYPLYAEVTQMVDPDEAAYSDLLRLMAEMLDREFGDRPEMERVGNNVRDWFREVTELKDEEVERSLKLGGDFGIGGEAGVEGEAAVPGLAKGKLKTGLGKILASIGWTRRSSKKEGVQIRERLERYPHTLRDNVNLMLDVAQRIVDDHSPNGILFVLDNIDRYRPEMVNEALVRNANLFQEIFAHMIFTVPISLLYNPIEDQVQDRFTTETLPMAPVRNRQTRSVRADVIGQLVEAVHRRVPAKLFADAGVVERLVLSSGGCPRDLLRLLQRSLIEAEDSITMGNAARAEAIVRAEYARPVTRDQYATLAKVHIDTAIDSDEAGRQMLFRRQVLEYNGERWVDVHPLLQQTKEFETALAEEKRVRNLPS